MYRCRFCLEDILDSQDKFMVAFENPYLNVYVHRDCWKMLNPITKESAILLIENDKKFPIIGKNKKKVV